MEWFTLPRDERCTEGRGGQRAVVWCVVVCGGSDLACTHPPARHAHRQQPASPKLLAAGFEITPFIDVTQLDHDLCFVLNCVVGRAWLLPVPESQCVCGGGTVRESVCWCLIAGVAASTRHLVVEDSVVERV